MAITERDKQYLQAEIPVFRREIQTLYRRLDKEYGLHGADVPMTFSFDESVLGSYTPKTPAEREHFHFSLYFIGYCNKDSMHASDKLDLYKHEYAHYMAEHMRIPKEHCWQTGKHGSAWKYCCSLIGAVPTPYYKIGESLQKQDYEKALKNPWKDKNFTLVDQHRQEQKYRKERDSRVRFHEGDTISHPKFGEGRVLKVIPTETSVRLQIVFGNEEKTIDQKWLIRANCRKLT